MTKTDKENLLKDFAVKSGEYFQRNYGSSGKGNYLRQQRRDVMADCIVKTGPHARVLDVGCGPAVLFPEALKICEHYTASDISPHNLEVLRQANPDPRIECVCSDLDHATWPQAAFDLVVCSGAIEYMDDPEGNLVKLLHWLKPGGTLVCSFPNAASPYRLWSEFVYTPLSALLKRMIGKPMHRYRRALFSESRLRRLLEDRGCSVDVEYLGFKILLQPLDTLLPGLDQRLVESHKKRPSSSLDRYCCEFVILARAASRV